MININRYSKVPIYEQVIEQIQTAVLTGDIKANDPLPSIRALSQEISINPNTIQKAYAELERRGISNSVIGSGRFVSPDAMEIISRSKQGLFDDINKLVSELLVSGWTVDGIIERIRVNALRITDDKGAN